MKALNLFLAIALAIVTTCIILLFFFTAEVSRLNAEIITLFSIIGYLGSALYYQNYKQLKTNNHE